MLDYLISLLPVFISALLGAISQDLAISMLAPVQSSILSRIAKVAISTVLVTFLVGFGAPIIFKDGFDWKVQCLAAYVIGYLGFQLATVFSKSTAGIRLFGAGPVADVLDAQRVDDLAKKVEEKLRRENDL